MFVTRKTSQRRNRGRSVSPGSGTSASLPATSARCSVIAALSVITLPSGSSSVGTCATGLIGPSRARASADANRSSTSSIVNGNPYQTNCASTSTEPHPRRPNSLYIASASGFAMAAMTQRKRGAHLFPNERGCGDLPSARCRCAADVGALLGDAGFLEANASECCNPLADAVLRGQREAQPQVR